MELKILEIVFIFTLIYFAKGRSVQGQDVCSNIEPFKRIDCHPDGSPDESSCKNRGCCWSPLNDPHDPNEPGIPFCFYAENFVNYEIKHKAVSASRIYLWLTRRQVSNGFPKNIENLLVDVSGITNDTIRVKITDPKNKRFQVVDPQLNVDLIKATTKSKKILYNVDVVDSTLVFKRTDGNRVILKIDLAKLIYADQYIQLPLDSLPSSSIYGLGEHYENFRIDFNSSYRRLIFLTRDASPAKYMPAYGTHPFYLMKEVEGNSATHGVLFFNNHVSEATLVPSKSLWYRTTGGIIDMFVFLGPTANDVIATKNKLIGLPAMPPYWSLGFHLCRYGYKSTADVNETLRRNREAGVPVDIQWVDIDHMDKRNDFVLDPNFLDLKKLVDQMHNENIHFVPILDPAVSGSEVPGSYRPYDLGNELDIFIKSPNTGKTFIGKVWNPVTSVFPDFTHPATDLYWSELVKDYHQKVPFDGLWIDMNEPANMIDGEKDIGCPANSTYDHPPFDPSVRNGWHIFKKTICMSCPQYLGLHYDLHNMYSYYESMRTWNALETVYPNKRHFVLSRATVTGQGKYSFHWTGDNFSVWRDLKQSITDILNFNLFGMPMVGADICGFNGKTDVELCARWSALGAFYPFSRNHNADNAPDQDPAILGQDVVDAAKHALKIRYQLLPYLYTLLYQSSITGIPVVRSLALEYPNDLNTNGIETQFLLGTGIMVSPVVEPNVRQVTPYFPVGTEWLDYVTRKSLIKSTDSNREVTIPCNLTEISVAMKAGHVIPTFTEPKMSVMDTVRESAYTLLIAPDEHGNATGALFADSGDEPIEFDTSKNSYIIFRVTKTNSTFSLTSRPHRKLFRPTEGQGKFYVEKVVLLNVKPSHVAKVKLSSDSDSFESMTGNFEGKNYVISGLKEDLNKVWSMSWGSMK